MGAVIGWESLDAVIGWQSPDAVTGWESPAAVIGWQSPDAVIGWESPAAVIGWSVGVCWLTGASLHRPWLCSVRQHTLWWSKCSHWWWTEWSARDKSLTPWKLRNMRQWNKSKMEKVDLSNWLLKSVIQQEEDNYIWHKNWKMALERKKPDKKM